MAKAQLSKNTTLADVRKEFSPNVLVKTAIFKVNSDKSIIQDEFGIFLLNPESYEETKSSNWVPQNVPGQSDPVYQWVSGGPRTLTFDALVTRETSEFSKNKNRQKSALESIIPSVTGTIGASISKVAGIGKALSQVSNISTSKFTSKSIESASMDISAELNFYRSLLYPQYTGTNKPERLKASPPLVVLFSGSAINKFPLGTEITSKTDLWMVTNLRIQHTKFLPNMAPMEAIVSFQLTQYTIEPFEEKRFTSTNRS